MQIFNIQKEIALSFVMFLEAEAAAALIQFEEQANDKFNAPEMTALVYIEYQSNAEKIQPNLPVLIYLHIRNI